MDALQPSTQSIEYPDDGKLFEGYLAFASSQPSPCLLVAHDWSGLNPSTRAFAEKVATLGYVAFAMDVYGKGIRGTPTGDNSALIKPLIEDRALLRRRLLAALRTAQSLPQVDPTRIGVIGHCFGGLCALDLARAAPPELLAAVSFHGVLKPPPLGEQAPISAAILILHGWEDPTAPPSDVVAIAEELTAAGADWQIQVYGHTMHTFTFPGAQFPERGLQYNASADRRSWAAMQAFLTEVFG